LKAVDKLGLDVDLFKHKREHFVSRPLRWARQSCGVVGQHGISGMGSPAGLTNFIDYPVKRPIWAVIPPMPGSAGHQQHAIEIGSTMGTSIDPLERALADSHVRRHDQALLTCQQEKRLKST